MDCQIKSDAGCLMEFALLDEVKAQSITQAKLEHLLTDYVLPAYRTGGKDEPSESTTPLRDTGELILTRRWSFGNRSSVLVAHVATTRDGAKAPNLIRGLIFLTMITKYQRSPDEHQILSWIRGIAADEKRLRSLGFDGVYDRESKQVIDWTTLRKNFIHKAMDHGMANEESYLPASST